MQSQALLCSGMEWCIPGRLKLREVTDAPMTGIPKSKTSSAMPGFIAGVINAAGKGWLGGLSGSSNQFLYALLCYLANQLGTVV